MSEKPANTWLIPAIGAALIGFVVIGPQKTAEIGTANIANLPALNKALENLDEDTDRRFKDFQEQLDRRLDKEIKPRIDELARQLEADKRSRQITE